MDPGTRLSVYQEEKIDQGRSISKYIGGVNELMILNYPFLKILTYHKSYRKHVLFPI